MGFTCPPRSKFCNVTRRRVAKFDHFCGWMNNCIGENNLKYFVSFLAMHVALCGYLAWLCFAVVYGELTRRGLWGVAFEGAGGEPVTLAQDWALLSKFCMYHFGPILMEGVFLVILVVMLGAFFGYHCWMIKHGVTTNETFKWKDHRRRVLRAARMLAAGEGEDEGEGDSEGEGEGDDDSDDDDEREVGCVGATASEKEKEDEKKAKRVNEQKKQKAAGAAKAKAADGATVVKRSGGGGGMLSRIPFARRLGLAGGAETARLPKVVVDVPPTRNIYDKGLRQNIAEVFFPPSQIAARELAAKCAPTTAPTTSSSHQQKGKHGKSRRG
jgi:hypothetical protein